MSEIQGIQIGESRLLGKPKKVKYPVTKTKFVLEGDETQEQINKRLWKALSEVLVAQNVLAISEDGYWIVDGQKTDFKAVGDKGEPGVDGKTPLLRVSADGMSLEISTDGGDTWLPFIVDFNKLRVLGYVDSIAMLPKNANIGDIYGVWNQEAQEGQGAYELYINTVKDWVEDYTITKVYDYDTELPSSATDGTAVLVPVIDLTLDKEKVDGYKVYKFNLATNGWVLVLNTAEIYANKEDIINYGDNVYALVQGATEGTYELYKRQTGWIYFGTNASITYHLVQDINEGTPTNVLSGKTVKDAVEAEASVREQAVSEINQTIDSFKQEVKDTYGDYTENPEFVRVVTDKEDKVLYGVQKDGNFYFGAGCPQQVKDYIQQKIDTIMGVGDVTEKIDTINEMIAFFEGIRNDETLRHLLETSAASIAAERARAEAAEQALDIAKVNKEEGKGLIPLQYIEETDNLEFIHVETDAEDKVLEGIQKDGTKVVGGGINIGGNASIEGDATIKGNVTVNGISYQVIESPEWIWAILDTKDKIVCGIRQDGKFVADVDGIDSKLAEIISQVDAKMQELEDNVTTKLAVLTDIFYAVESSEWIDVKTDSQDKVLEGTHTDGSKEFYDSVTVRKELTVGDSIELNAASQSSVENPEYLETKQDAEDKILEGIKTDGTKVIGGNLEVGGDMKIGGEINFTNGIPQEIVDYVAANTGSGISSIEYEDETGDMYATYDDADGVTDVYMDENGDIYAEIEE